MRPKGCIRATLFSRRLILLKLHIQNLNESLEEEAPNGISEIVYLKIESQGRYQRAQTLGNSQSTTGNILRNQGFAKTNKLRKQYEPNQVNEPMHQRQPPPSNANTTEQPLVQAEGNNEQKGTEREQVSKKQVSESGETGPLTTQ
ncbi:Hypothetical_protein [Hexamita inflata]|uniref:Hypothetical_protein n=1 Tax=Hexamita inflata TaxID=28002 RepID=A0AA86PW76_9EUKA|nr:Hypothetical protein HINF_LOCUS17020 [Hexamita inflata]CAI9947399.1 Hypothetical protein HINF_LOCUS35044 [Hexamita inflata]